MAIWKDTWRFHNSIEHEIKHAGNYGARGEKRAKRKKATPEQIREQNQKNRAKKVRRLIKANFLPGDIWATLKYHEGIRKPLSEVRDDMEKFLRQMRREYKKRGEALRFVYRMEIGKHGGIHIHFLVNRSGGKPDTDTLLQSIWTHGRVYYTSIYEEGGYQKLANYITKQPDEEVEGQLSLFDDQERGDLIRYSSSRNLIRPKPERKVYRRRTVRKLIEQGPKPTKGFYIDPNSIRQGVNPYTGMSYYHYTEYRLEQVRRNGLGKSCKP